MLGDGTRNEPKHLNLRLRPAKTCLQGRWQDLLQAWSDRARNPGHVPQVTVWVLKAAPSTCCALAPSSTHVPHTSLPLHPATQHCQHALTS